MNDIKSLEKILLDNKINQSDIDLLKEAITQDNNAIELKKGNFGSSVAKWLGGMVAKTVSKASNVWASKLVDLLTKTINDFYGF